MIDDIDGQLTEETECAKEAVLEQEAACEAAPKQGRFTTNLAANLGVFAFNLLVGLWFTPYLVHSLGMASYGIVPLITQITSYMAVITLTLNAGVGRYLTISLEQKNHEEANQYFNTSFFGSIFFVLVLLIPAGLATIYIDRLIVVPDGLQSQVKWLFACAIGAFFLNTLQTPFGVSTYYMNRFDLRNAIHIVQQVARVGVVVLAFTLFEPQVWIVGLGALISMCLGWGWSIRLWRYLTPTLHISISHFNTRVLKSLVSTGCWLSLTQFGALLFLAIDLLVVNRLFGPDAGGRYALAAQWANMLRAVAATVGAVFGPTIVRLYGQGDVNSLVTYTKQAVKFCGLFIGLPVMLVCGLSEPLLRTWLGPQFADISGLMTVCTIYLSLTLAMNPIFSVELATNRLFWPGITTFVFGGLNLFLAIMFSYTFGWGPIGVAWAMLVTLLAKNVLFTVLYSAHILEQPLTTFLYEIVPITCSTLSFIVAGKLLCSYCDCAGWVRLIAAGMLLSFVYAVFCYFLMLNNTERAMFWKLALNFIPTRCKRE